MPIMAECTMPKSIIHFHKEINKPLHISLIWPHLVLQKKKKKEAFAGHGITPNTGANVTRFFTLVTKSWKLVAKLATKMFHHNLT